MMTANICQLCNHGMAYSLQMGYDGLTFSTNIYFCFEPLEILDYTQVGLTICPL